MGEKYELKDAAKDTGESSKRVSETWHQAREDARRSGEISSKDNGCFIATTVYGSYFDPRVKILRDFRDNYLLTSVFGRFAVGVYYQLSPPIVDFTKRHDISRVIIKGILTPIVFFLKNRSN